MPLIIIIFIQSSGNVDATGYELVEVLHGIRQNIRQQLSKSKDEYKVFLVVLE